MTMGRGAGEGRGGGDSRDKPENDGGRVSENDGVGVPENDGVGVTENDGDNKIPGPWGGRLRDELLAGIGKTSCLRTHKGQCRSILYH